MMLGKLDIHMYKILTRPHNLAQMSIQTRSKTFNQTFENATEKHKETLDDIGKVNNFLNNFPVIQEIRGRIDKWC
jgi:hypothetical protein